MSPRSYRLGQRTAAVEETRLSVLGAARALLGESGVHRVSIDGIARRAGVARATVYHRFGSKLGLLEALLADTQARAGLEQLGRLALLPDPVAILRAGLREHCHYWAAEQDVFRNLIGLAAIDPDARRAVHAQDARWERGIEDLARRLARAGALRPGCSRRRATAVLRLLFSFETFDTLHSRCGLRPNAVADVLLELARETVPEL